MNDSGYTEWDNSDYAKWHTRFQRFFRPAYRETEIFDKKIETKGGLLIFKFYRYTMDELLESEHHAKIYSVTEQSGIIPISFRCI